MVFEQFATHVTHHAKGVLTEVKQDTLKHDAALPNHNQDP
jgi:hypothetical protein